MKTVDYYMSLPYKIELYPDVEEGGYAVSYPELPGCLSCGETIEECIESIDDCENRLFAYIYIFKVSETKA